MAKYKLQEMSNLNGVGEKRVFPKLVANRQLDTKEFVEKLHSYNRAVPESIVSAVIADLGTCLGEMLAMGYTVKLDDIGTFSLSLDFDDNKLKVVTYLAPHLIDPIRCQPIMQSLSFISDQQKAWQIISRANP